MSMDKDLLLLGSLPYETAEKLRAFGTAFGNDLPALPDGEVLDRRRWVAGLGLAVSC